MITWEDEERGEGNQSFEHLPLILASNMPLLLSRFVHESSSFDVLNISFREAFNSYLTEIPIHSWHSLFKTFLDVTKFGFILYTLIIRENFNEISTNGSYWFHMTNESIWLLLHNRWNFLIFRCPKVPLFYLRFLLRAYWIISRISEYNSAFLFIIPL